MDALKLFWTSTAIKQRNYIFNYWNKRNKNTIYSVKLNKRIVKRTNLLKTNPKLGKKTDFNNTRTTSLGHYSLFYKKIDNMLIITGFWDNRQDPVKLVGFL